MNRVINYKQTRFADPNEHVMKIVFRGKSMRGKKMMKTYITTLSVVLLAGTQFVRAQESTAVVLADLDAANAAAQTEEAKKVAVETEAAKVASTSATLYERAIASYNAGKYDESKAFFDAMILADKYDTRPARYQKRIARKIKVIEAKKKEAARLEAMARNEKEWTVSPVLMIATNETAATEADSPRTIAIREMEAKLKSIIIPTLDFRDANVKDVVIFLTETCRRLDKENGRGVNLLLLGMGSYDDNANPVTISIRDMSLYTALGYISEMAKLQFEVRPTAVALMPLGYASPADMLLRTYDIKSNEVGEQLSSSSSTAAPAETTGTGDLFGDTAATSTGGTSGGGPINVKGFFSVVKFPEGSKAEYQSKFKKLICLNTPQNLKLIEEILGTMEDKAKAQLAEQVKIDAKFIEFNEGSMEQLGFDWTVYGTGTAAGFGLKDGTYFQKTSGFLIPRTPYDPNDSAQGGNGRWDTTTYVPGTTPTPLYTRSVDGYTKIANNGQGFWGGAMRNASGVFNTAKSGVLSTMNGNPAAMVFGDGSVDLRITMLEQNGTADVLSAPSVTTKSGNEAIIRVVEVHRYPQDYDVETGRNTVPVVKPQDWEDFDLGVSLKVTPVVNADTGTIDLDLAPEITKFKGFDNYIVGYNNVVVGGDYNSGGGNSAGDNRALLARMPYFEKRVITTQVTIADGSSILMGGLVSELTETYRDQIPFLGDIPYLGRLFRTEGSRSSKRNLVIYVKAKQIDINGMSAEDRKQNRAAQLGS